jgi:mono/diheme cytochrome c family protein
MTERTFGLRLLMLAAAVWIPALSAQEKPPASVSDGIYTTEQAGRGEAVYKESCASCHGPTLEGKGQVPPLSGSDFMAAWKDLTVWDLFDRIEVSMPADHPGQLSPEQNAAVLAYIFKMNSFPAGNKELPTGEDALKVIRIDTRAP